MKQLNIRIDTEFEKRLAGFMEKNRISTKSAALKKLLSLAQEYEKVQETNFNEWIGIALKSPTHKKKKKYLTEDDLWS